MSLKTDEQASADSELMAALLECEGVVDAHYEFHTETQRGECFEVMFGPPFGPFNCPGGDYATGIYTRAGAQALLERLQAGGGILPEQED